MVTLSSVVALLGLGAAFMFGRHTKDSSTLKTPFNIIAYVLMGLAVVIALFNTGGRLGRLGGMGMGMGGMGMGGGFGY